jgi:hypothetical protein
MKRDFKFRSNGPPPSARQNLLDAPALHAEAQRVAKQRKDQAMLWRALWLGGLVIVVIFVGLEGFQPAPQAAAPQPMPVKPSSIRPSATRVNPPVEAAVGSPNQAAAEPASKEPVLPLPSPRVPGGEEIAGDTPTEAERVAAESVLQLTGLDAQRDAAISRDQELLKQVILGKAWDAYRGLLGKSVQAGLARLALAQGPNRFDLVWSEPVLYQALLRWKTLGCFSESEITSLVTDSYSGAMLTWLLHDNPAMEELLLTVHPKDDGAKILKFFIETWSINERTYPKYFPLAVACAVVFDEPMAIPNPLGKSKFGVKESLVDPVSRYLWYVEKNEKGKLAAPVHHSSARDLVWVVCAPVSTSELEWSLDKMQLRRKNWGQAYGMVEYLMERAVNGLNPYKEYSFSEILKRGGVCGDQSYFCVNTARAQGIPAMTISGETQSGAHAWAGVKIDADEWTTGVGRIGGASKGQASNPQTGTAISEQEIQLWNDRFHQSAVVTLAVWRHLWLADFFASTNNSADHAVAVRLANRVGHSFTETWQAVFALLNRQTQLTGDPPVPNNLDEWKSFASDMRREFKDNPRMAELAARAEVEYIFPYGSEGDARRSLMRDRRRIERDSGEQKDLIASSLKREAEVILKQGGPDSKREISRLYDRALRDYGGSITGFKMMAGDYFGYAGDDKELARKAARDIELAFKRVVETGTKDWFRATTEASIYQMICGYYRSAGDPDRATLLEKRQEVLLRRSKRGAL